MKKITIISIFFFLINAAMAMGNYRNLPYPFVEEYYGAFSTETTAPAVNLKMFDDIEKTRPIGRISFLGTHNSGSIQFSGSLINDIFRTQTLSIAQQLRLGVRFMDFRLRHTAKEYLQFYHEGNAVAGNKNLESALLDIKKFLDENPTEFVLIRIRNEDSNNPIAVVDGVNFASAVNVNLYSVKDRVASIPNNKNIADITLEQASGKIYILADYYNGEYSGEPTQSVASPYRGVLFGVARYNKFKAYTQDEYRMSSNWDMYRKIKLVADHLYKANDYYNNNDFVNSIYINYLSASVGGFPYFFAGGRSHANTNAPHLLTGSTETSTGINRDLWPDFPRYSCTAGPGWICSIFFAGVNEVISMRIFGMSLKYVGVLMTDFPGRTMADAVKHVNKMSYSSVYGRGLKTCPNRPPPC